MELYKEISGYYIHNLHNKKLCQEFSCEAIVATEELNKTLLQDEETIEQFLMYLAYLEAFGISIFPCRCSTLLGAEMFVNDYLQNK